MLRVLAIPFVIGTAFQQHVVDAVRTDLRRRMRVRNRPPELLRLNASFCFRSAATSS